jgi:hypothetical protein
MNGFVIVGIALVVLIAIRAVLWPLLVRHNTKRRPDVQRKWTDPNNKR